MLIKLILYIYYNFSISMKNTVPFKRWYGYLSLILKENTDAHSFSVGQSITVTYANLRS